MRFLGWLVTVAIKRDDAIGAAAQMVARAGCHHVVQGPRGLIKHLLHEHGSCEVTIAAIRDAVQVWRNETEEPADPKTDRTVEVRVELTPAELEACRELASQPPSSHTLSLFEIGKRAIHRAGLARLVFSNDHFEIAFVAKPTPHILARISSS